MMNEIWKEAVGYEGYYEVSSYGRVKSLRRRVRCGENRHRTIKGKILKPVAGSGNYLYVTINAKPLACKTEAVHRLVAYAFLGDRPDDDYQVNHIDGNKENNRAENLEWVTPKQNSRHAAEMGLMPHGERCATSKLTDEEVVKIRVLVKSGATRSKLKKKHNVSRGTIDAIMQGRAWAHTLPDDYVPPSINISGENNPAAKLTESQIMAIRDEYSTGGVSQQELGEKYGVTQTHIGAIVRRDVWAHV